MSSGQDIPNNIVLCEELYVAIQKFAQRINSELWQRTFHLISDPGNEFIPYIGNWEHREKKYLDSVIIPIFTEARKENINYFLGLLLEKAQKNKELTIMLSQIHRSFNAISERLIRYRNNGTRGLDSQDRIMLSESMSIVRRMVNDSLRYIQNAEERIPEVKEFEHYLDVALGERNGIRTGFWSSLLNMDKKVVAWGAAIAICLGIVAVGSITPKGDISELEAMKRQAHLDWVKVQEHAAEQAFKTIYPKKK